jgi:hypothetical protein
MAETERYTAAKNALHAHDSTCTFCHEEGFVNPAICPERRPLVTEVSAAFFEQDDAEKTRPRA